MSNPKAPKAAPKPTVKVDDKGIAKMQPAPAGVVVTKLPNGSTLVNAVGDVR